jgi:uncharacterized protein (DUF1015 family)
MMAIVKPFKGIRYNPHRVRDLSQVISQPYDRIQHGLQEKYYQLSDFNVVRIIKGKEFPEDNEERNVYTRAHQYLGDWLEQGILMQEERPALYVLHQDFPLPSGDIVTRKALISSFKLSRFNEGIVLPHERTLSGPKVDRLKLTRATQAYFGNIFMLYPDRTNKITDILENALNRKPDADVREIHEKDVRQRFWVVTDPQVIAAVTKEMAPKNNLVIADGHHRYETALNYRDEQRSQYPDAPDNVGFEYLMVALVSMSDPGLIILPTHRLIHDYRRMSGQELLQGLGGYFNIEPLPHRAALEAQLTREAGEIGRIGAVTSQRFFLLRFKDPAIMDKLAPNRVRTWRELDVSILHELILEHLMGLTKESIERKENIEYLREPDLGYDQIASGEAQFMFLLNPTRMEQVVACTQAGEKMPQKSTDFYPKVITGLTFLPVGPDELL